MTAAACRDGAGAAGVSPLHWVEIELLEAFGSDGEVRLLILDPG
jgi:hypothetical protein